MYVFVEGRIGLQGLVKGRGARRIGQVRRLNFFASGG